MKKALTIFTLAMAIAPWAIAQSTPAAQANTGTQVKVVKGPVVEYVDDNSAVIAWTTDGPSSAIVHYGTDPAHMTQMSEQKYGGSQGAGSDRVHRTEVRGLQPNTTYYFQVESGKGTPGPSDAMSAANTFKTLTTEAAKAQWEQKRGMNGSATNSSGAPGAVHVSDANATSITDTSAVITWTTDRPSSAIVHYGLQAGALGQTAEEAWGGTQSGSSTTHSVQLKNLKPDTTYYYDVESGQGKGIAGGGDTSSAAKTFKTLPAGSAPQSASNLPSDQLKVQAGPIPQAVTDKTATIWWMTTGDTPTAVKYGTDKNNLNQTAQGAAGKEHRVDIANLQPGTTYYFDVTGGNSAIQHGTGQFATMGPNYQAEAAKIRVTKGPVIEYITQDQAIIAWSTTARSSSLVRYGTDPNNLNQTAEAPWGQDTHRVTIKNLKPNTAYYFVVESSQAQGTGAIAKSEPAPFSTVDKGQQAMINHEPR